MTPVPLFLVILVTFVPESGAAEVEVLEPTSTVGDEIGLIFIPDVGVWKGKYTKTGMYKIGRSIQHESLRSVSVKIKL